MATTQFTFGVVGTPGDNIQVMLARGQVSESFTPSGSNQTTTATAVRAIQSFARVATDTAVYVSFGASPNATSDAGRFLIPANGVEYFLVEAGDKAAVATIAE